MTDAEILGGIDRAFAECPRPEHFTNYRHCCECFEHDELLGSRDRESLRHEDVGPPACDPVCFLSPEGFSYYFPSLARFALSEPHPTWGWYGSQLAHHLRRDGPRNDRWAHCTPEQRRAVAALLEHIIDTRPELVDVIFDADVFFQTLEVWSDDGATPP